MSEGTAKALYHMSTKLINFLSSLRSSQFEDSYVPSFKNVCGAIVDCVGYFALCTPGGEDFGTSREFRHKMFVAKQVLHSEFYLHIKSESRNIRRGRGVHGRDLVSMSEEQRLGFVGNSVLSQMAGANAKFWAREGYEGKLLRTCRGDIKGTEGELNRLEVVSELNQAARKHVEGNAGMVGVEEVRQGGGGQSEGKRRQLTYFPLVSLLLSLRMTRVRFWSSYVPAGPLTQS